VKRGDPVQDHAFRFGFESVEPETKTRRVGGVFQDVARQYDLMNDLMSGGIHRLWKKRLVERMSLFPGMTLLDVAGGTGDMALAALEHLRETQQQGMAGTRLVVCDLNPAMLEAGQRRAWDKGIVDPALSWIQDDACTLSSVPDQSADVYVVTFGLRNMTWLDKALVQARRVLRPEGRFYALEFGTMEPSWCEKIYRLWLMEAIPEIGRQVTGCKDAYRYLAESIMSFPEPSALTELLLAAGFRYACTEPWTRGIVRLYWAWGVRS
jgi:ubiquinone/menaquinone biosynthesis methyltransferase